jgi:hypothetical protein
MKLWRADVAYNASVTANKTAESASIFVREDAAPGDDVERTKDEAEPVDARVRESFLFNARNRLPNAISAWMKAQANCSRWEHRQPLLRRLRKFC